MKHFEHIHAAKQTMLTLSEKDINNLLEALAKKLDEQHADILAANKKDLAKKDESDPTYDRLMLSTERLTSIAEDIRNVAKLPYSVGDVLEERDLESGLHLKKVRVPLGVVGVVYEARPNVTFDVFSLCFKSGNVCVLKGGSDAVHSNEAIVSLIHDVLTSQNIDSSVLTLLPSDRSSVDMLLHEEGIVDVVIPRGSKQLIDHVRKNATVPVIETGAGVVHTYVDASANIKKAKNIITNAKTRRVSVCNALDTVLLHRSLLSSLPAITADLASKEVLIYADSESYAVLKDIYPKDKLMEAGEEHFGIEFLSCCMSLKTVENFDEALAHIAEFSSKHSEAIVAEDSVTIARFINEVDAAAVYSNASTAFTDGAQFGLGAEIGISTQKLHARGPMGLQELTSYKWIVEGNGQTRP